MASSFSTPPWSFLSLASSAFLVRIDDEAESMFDWMWKSFQRMCWRITSS